MRCSRPRTFSVLFCALLYSAVSFAQEIPTAKPFWKVDLRELARSDYVGYSRAKTFFSLSTHPTVFFTAWEEVAFARGDPILVAFSTRKIVRKGLDRAGSKQHLLSLDAVTGKIVAALSWSGLYADYASSTRDGDFVFMRGRRVTLYSAGLQEMKSLDVGADPGAGPAYGGWSLFVPPDGDSIFLQRASNGSVSLHMLDAQSLQETRSWPESAALASASGKYLATWRSHRGVYVRGFDTPWHLISPESPCANSWLAYRTVRFVNEDSLLVIGCDQVQLLGVDGKTLFATQGSKGHPINDAWASLDGRFIAVSTDRMSGVTIEALDTYRSPAPWRIFIYDTKNGNVVSALNAGRRFGKCVFSPDGSRVVLLSDGIVELFSLPRSSRGTFP